MDNPIIRRLEQFGHLCDDDRADLDRLLERKRVYRNHDELAREGDPPRHAKLLIEGWACRYKLLGDGRRQILQWLLPGDVCDADVFLLDRMDHSIAAIGPVTVAELSRDVLAELVATRPGIAEALSREALVTTAIQREWTANLGQRNAAERIAHLFCEAWSRLRAVGLTTGRDFDFPVTQVELADAAGMSAVHVNRTVQELRSLGLLVWNQRRVTIPDFAALARLAMFDPLYLHLGAAPDPSAGWLPGSSDDGPEHLHQNFGLDRLLEMRHGFEARRQ